MIEVRLVETSATGTSVALAGDLDRDGSDDCRRALQHLLTGSPRLVVDVADVSLHDPSGAGMLLGLAFFAAVHDREFVVAGASDEFDALFRMMRFDHRRSKAASRRRRSRVLTYQS